MSLVRSTLHLSIAVLMFAAFQTQAADGTFPVTSNVVQSCVVSIPASLDFGVYDPIETHLSAAAQAQTNINVKCSAGAPVATVYMGKGTTPNATYKTCASPLRQMLNTAYPLNYNLYQDNGMTVAWGCNTGLGNLAGKTIGPFTNSLTPLSLTVYGKIPPGQLSPVGNYVDTVNVWVAF